MLKIREVQLEQFHTWVRIMCLFIFQALRWHSFSFFRSQIPKNCIFRKYGFFYKTRFCFKNCLSKRMNFRLVEGVFTPLFLARIFNLASFFKFLFSGWLSAHFRTAHTAFMAKCQISFLFLLFRRKLRCLKKKVRELELSVEFG